MTLKPFDFQHEVLDEIDVFGLRGLVSLDMGLGKTLIALWSILRNDAFPAVVVCPASVKYIWEREAERVGIGSVVLEGRGRENDSGKDGGRQLRLDSMTSIRFVQYSERWPGRFDSFWIGSIPITGPFSRRYGMKLEDIGFYTLTDDRARYSSVSSPLSRCELLLTDRCNFRCPYCRGSTTGELSQEQAKKVIDLWAVGKLQSIRFSGGEPTLFGGLIQLVERCVDHGIENIAISTNGSADWKLYEKLIDAGANDFSVSLDACCSAFGKRMVGGIPGMWEKVVDNIQSLSKHSYVTVGIVLTKDNIGEAAGIVEFADGLGVSDIRIISAAQYNRIDRFEVKEEILARHPILRYRLGNLFDGRGVRGIKECDAKRCRLVLDDMAVAGGCHYPCIIALREGCKPIGTMVGKTIKEIRWERLQWMLRHNSQKDTICKKNCLDVCVDYNNKARKFQ